VIGAGIVGACCAYSLTCAGLRVAVLDRGPVTSGTTGAGEGNILVSDKVPGPELDLSLLSIALWRRLDSSLGPRAELEEKGGLVVAATTEALEALYDLSDRQRAQGVAAQRIGPDDVGALEPNLAPGLAGGVLYSQDMQVQPMLAAAMLLRLARHHGAGIHASCLVTGIDKDATGAVRGVCTEFGTVLTPIVVNAGGTWGGEIARLAGVDIPILPRRGFILVTEPLPIVVRHKVYAADYVANVASGARGLETSAVVEGTRAGTVLIGSSRERVGFDRSMSLSVVARLARQAIQLFPCLADVLLLRTYSGFRPHCPDNLPVIGPDRRVPGLFHACGHEGAGIGLAPATGHLIAQAATGQPTELPLESFAPHRFGADDAA
jgi:D-hydroxyproline dehydrogenase subunit beta